MCVRIPSFGWRIPFINQHRLVDNLGELVSLAHRLNHLKARLLLLNLWCVVDQSALMIVDKRACPMSAYLIRGVLLGSGIHLIAFL